MVTSILVSLVVIGLLSFSMNRKHLLSMLLSLEFISLALFVVLSNHLMCFSYESFFMMVFLTFAVCEGSLGLSILVSMVRTHGDDNFSSFNVLW